MKVCNLLDEVFATIYVSDPYSSTELTLLLKIRSLVLALMFVDLQSGLRVIKACLALPILAFASSSVQTKTEITLPR